MKSNRDQFKECNQNNSLSRENCPQCGQELLMCLRYGGQCMSKKCLIDRKENKRFNFNYLALDKSLQIIHYFDSPEDLSNWLWGKDRKDIFIFRKIIFQKGGDLNEIKQKLNNNLFEIK